MTIKPPIIVDERGDTKVYKSIEDAEMDLEVIDVQNGEYVAYDSEGRLLTVIPISPYRVAIASTEQEPNHIDELHAILFRFLLHLGFSADWLKRASLQDLVVQASKYENDLTFHSPLEGLLMFFKRWFNKEL